MTSSYEEIINELAGYSADLGDDDIIIPDLVDGFSTPIRKIKEDFTEHDKSLKICHLNAVSIPKHRDEIYRIIRETDMDIIGVSETNIKRATPADRYRMEGYKLYKEDRNHTTKGGVGIYVRNELKAKRIKVNYSELQPELCFVEITIAKAKLLVGVIYKSPKENYEVYGKILEILAFMTTKYKHVILLGDYNIDQLDVNTAKYKYFKQTIMEPLNLKQLVRHPTRITKSTCTLIDLIMVNEPDSVKMVGVTDIPGISDHCMVYTAYGISKQKFKKKIITRRDFRKFSEVDFNRDMENAAWGSIYAVEDEVDDQVTIIENIYSEIINKHAPFREIKVKHPVCATWMTDEIVKLMDKRDQYKNKYNKTKSNLIFDLYKQLKNKVNHMIRKAKYKDFQEKINEKIHNSKEFHKALRDLSVVNSKCLDENIEISAEVLNMNFVANNNAEVNANSIEEEIRNINKCCVQTNFKFKEVCEKDVVTAVKSIHTNACGLDGISAYFIKLSIDSSKYALTELINTSLRLGKFPSRWKKAIIKPIPKCSNPTAATDFRPISLLITFSKILEKIVAKQIVEYFDKNSLMDLYQSAYKKYHSTATALLQILENINKAMDSSEITILTLLDYSKAFDCANHALIIAKLKALGFHNTASSWIVSYLSNRSQQVRTSNGNSEWILLKNGVPQGSILGPLLFTVLLSDLKKVIHHCKYHCYADDTQIYISGKLNMIEEMVQSMNDDLKNIADFSSRNCLKLNSKKSMFIIIGSPSNTRRLERTNIPEIKIEGKAIERKKHVTNLGVILDENLSFEKHVNEIIRKALFKLKMAFRFIKFLSKDSRIRVVEAYVLSQLNYCDVVWNSISQSLGTKIQKLQNTCIRFIYGLRKYDHISNKVKELNTLNMTNRRSVHALTLLHKIINNRAPKYLCSKIVRAINIHGHETRGRNNLVGSRYNNNYGKNSFLNKTIKEYNTVMQIIGSRQDCSSITFKSACKKHFLSVQNNI